MKVRILYFAAIRDLVGREGDEIDLPGEVRNVASFRRYLEAEFPSLSGRLAGVRVARNEAFAGNDEALAEGDCLALIPPVAGG